MNTASLRIFTPQAELPFAGHPTIGTAVLLALENAPDLIGREDVGLALEEKIGTIACSVRRRRGEAAHAHFDAPRAPEPWGEEHGREEHGGEEHGGEEHGGEPPDPARLARTLGLAAADIGFAGHRPTRFSAGNAMTFVPLASLDALGRATLVAAPGAKVMHYLYAAAAPTNGTRTFRTRMLSAGYGVPEDPATGSAAAAFPAALAAGEALGDGEHDCILLQGVEMGRPSRIGVAFAVRAGAVGAATIGGSAVPVAQGTLEV